MIDGDRREPHPYPSPTMGGEFWMFLPYDGRGVLDVSPTMGGELGDYLMPHWLGLHSASIRSSTSSSSI